MAKRSIVLFNLGGPDSPESVQPFLNNLFRDPAIINLPKILRLPISKLISIRRAPVAKKIYEHIGGCSPILLHTQDQSRALEVSLNKYDTNNNYRVFISMRYWHPLSEETAKQVKEFCPDEILLLPLYPQFSTTTSASSIDDWKTASLKVGLETSTYVICCYPIDENWTVAQSNLLKSQIRSLKKGENYRVLFSAHGLPKKIVEQGDPYQWQVENSAAAIATATGLEENCWAVCYQSRVGPLEWIGPSLDDELKRAAMDGLAVIVLPIAFVSEHSETLVELDIEYKKIAETIGVQNFKRVPALGTDPDFIRGLRDLAITAFQKKIELGPRENTRRCPPEATKCRCL